MAAAHITKAIRNIPLFQNANWINATLWLKMSNGVEGEKGGIRLDFTFDSSSLQFQEWLTPLCTKKFARNSGPFVFIFLLDFTVGQIPNEKY